MVQWKRTVLILAAIMAIMVSVILSGCGSSGKTEDEQTPSPTTTSEYFPTPSITPTETSQDDDGQAARENKELYIELYSQFLASLSTRLGLSPEELQSAVIQTEIDMISQAVGIGIINQEQAETIREMANSEGSTISSVLEEAVSSGVVTREEADLILQMIEEQVTRMVEVIAILAGDGDEEATAEVLAEAVDAGLITQEEAVQMMGQ
ncbi:MAG: hypothetical protein R6U37_01240 [Dehalococcoidia bacterium]